MKKLVLTAVMLAFLPQLAYADITIELPIPDYREYIPEIPILTPRSGGRTFTVCDYQRCTYIGGGNWDCECIRCEDLLFRSCGAAPSEGQACYGQWEECEAW